MHESSMQLTPDPELNYQVSHLLTTNTTKIQKSIPQITQYKNATYYGKYDQLNLHQGIGIVLYDNGDILVGEFKSGSLRGYFMYFVGAVEEGQACWVYGMYWEDRMEGWGYVYGRDHRAVRVLFRNGKVISDTRYTNNYGTRKQTMEFTNLYSPRVNIHKLPPGSPLNQHEFLKPTDFLESYLTQDYSQKSTSSSHIILPQSSTSHIQTQFQIFEIGNKQMFYGTIENNKPNGIGIIFVDEWPVCYGNFVDGQLNGLGRVEQNRLMVLDGVFEKSSLKTGWVFDLKENLTCFGTLIEDRNKKEIFKLSQQFVNIQIQKIAKFRRRKHLQALTYCNSHFFQFFDKIKSQFWSAHFQFFPDQQQQQQAFLSTSRQQNFVPSFISSISRIHNENTPKNGDSPKQHEATSRVQRNLLDLIRQYNDNQTNFEKNVQTLSLKVKQAEKNQQFNETYTKQNKVIVYNPTKSPQNRNTSKSFNQDIIEYISAKNQKRMLKNGSILNINKVTGEENAKKTAQELRKKPKADTVQKNRAQTDRKVQKRLDLHKMYTKYLRKQQ